MKFAIQDTLSGLGSYAKVFPFAKEVGYDGVEINLFQQPLNDALASDISKASESSGVPVAAVCGGHRHWIGHFDEEKRLEAVRDVRQSMKHASQMGAPGMITPAAFGMYPRTWPPFAPPRDRQGDRDALLDSLKRIAEEAEKRQVVLFLEPLNRYNDHMINTVADAVSILEEVGSPLLRVVADFFHMNIEEADIVETIKSYYTRIGYYHLADNNRLLPGKGHLDFRKPFAKLAELNYSGYLSIECTMGPDIRESLEEALRYLRSSAAAAALAD
ncbi:sugar phosphate isomerase/epimerase family protein [Paenibacillaceae bacterium WGS1546]|uniref:sugar phosphate isomerase/epimerase family protein n=1 Tax=Cohnella sp. WGS1546 TaxID=3366810 RepID=UPI00372D1BF6